MSMVHQGYIEPHNALAYWSADGHLRVECSSQGQFGIRSELADHLQWPISKINVFPSEIGGGFGGKTTIYLEPLAAVLSRKSGRPVKLTMSRSDILRATGPAPGRLRLGQDRRHERGADHGGAGHVCFRRRRIPGVGRWRGLPLRLRALQADGLPHRRPTTWSSTSRSHTPTARLAHRRANTRWTAWSTRFARRWDSIPGIPRHECVGRRRSARQRHAVSLHRQ